MLWEGIPTGDHAVHLPVAIVVLPAVVQHNHLSPVLFLHARAPALQYCAEKYELDHLSHAVSILAFQSVLWESMRHPNHTEDLPRIIGRSCRE